MESTTSPAGDQSVPPPPAPVGPAPRNDGFFDSLRRSGVVRTQDRWIGGVAGGIARRFGIDPLLVRGVLGVTVLLGGAGLVLYALGWALLPEEADGRIHLQETIRGRFNAALLGAAALLVIGLNRGDGWHGWWDDRGFGWINGLLWTAVLVAVVAMLVSAGNRRRSQAGPDGAPLATTWAGAPPPPRDVRTSPHPGYGTVPVAAAGAPPPPAWATTPVPPPPPGSGAPGGPAGATAFRPVQPPVPPAPPRPLGPRVEGPGVGAVGTVVGLSLLALAALLVVDREGELGMPVALTALGIGVVLAGLGIVVSGLRGRSSGTLGFLAILGLFATVPVALAPGFDDRFAFRDDFRDGRDGGAFGASTGETWRPSTAAEARRGISVGFDDLDVDLTDVPVGAGVVEVPIRMRAGDLRVVVPDDVAVTGEIALTAGQVTWDVDGESVVAGFTGGQAETYTSDEAADGDVQLAVRITAGAGEVRVEEDR